MREPNVPLLRKVVEWVEEQSKLTVDREWDQTWFIQHYARSRYMEGLGMVYLCDTTYCVAGKVAVDAGWEAYDESGAVHKNGETRYAADVAAELLGIPPWPSSSLGLHLFSENNTAEDIRRIAEEYAGEKL